MLIAITEVAVREASKCIFANYPLLGGADMCMCQVVATEIRRIMTQRERDKGGPSECIVAIFRSKMIELPVRCKTLIKVLIYHAPPLNQPKRYQTTFFCENNK